MPAAQATLLFRIGTLAQSGRYDEMRSYFQNSGTSVAMGYVVGAIVAGGLVLALAIWYSHRLAQRRGSRYHSHRRLFRELCRQHNLPWRQRRTLRQLARAERLAMPALLFIRPDYFRSRLLPQTLRPDVERLRALLFDDPPAER